MLIAMIAGSFISYLLGGAAAGIPLVGEIDFGFPEFGFPLVDWGMVQQLAPNAFAVTLLGLISSVAIAKAIAAKTGQRVDSSLEFIGQGLSNIVGGLFNCYAGSGSFTRSGINHESGAKTPLSVIFASGLLLIILLFVAPWTAFLPIPAMAGIIMLVAYYLIDFKYIRWILKVSGMESSVLIITFLATLFLNLEFAIYLGVIVSLILFLLKTSHPRVVPMGVLEDAIGKNLVSAIRMKNAVAIDNMEIIRIDGSLFFGSVDHVLQEIQEHTDKGTKYILIDGSAINNVDMQGVEMLVLVSDQLRKMGGGLYIYDLKRPVREYLTRGDYWKRIGPNNIFDSPWRAIHQAQMDMDSSAALSENGA